MDDVKRVPTLHPVIIWDVPLTFVEANVSFYVPEVWKFFRAVGTSIGCSTIVTSYWFEGFLTLLWVKCIIKTEKYQEEKNI